MKDHLKCLVFITFTVGMVGVLSPYIRRRIRPAEVYIVENRVLKQADSDTVSYKDSLSPAVKIGQVACKEVYTFYYKGNQLYRLNSSKGNISSVALWEEEKGEPYAIDFAALSKDKEYVLVIVNTGNCGIGGAMDGQELYKVNVRTLKSECLIEANEIVHTSKGFRAKSLILLKEGECNADNEYREEFTYYNADGEKISK